MKQEVMKFNEGEKCLFELAYCQKSIIIIRIIITIPIPHLCLYSWQDSRESTPFKAFALIHTVSAHTDAHTWRWTGTRDLLSLSHQITACSCSGWIHSILLKLSYAGPYWLRDVTPVWERHLHLESFAFQWYHKETFIVVNHWGWACEDKGLYSICV